MLSVKDFCDKYIELNYGTNHDVENEAKEFKDLFSKNPNKLYFKKNELTIREHDCVVSSIGYLKNGNFTLKFTGGIYSFDENDEEIFHGLQKVVVTCKVNKIIKLKTQKNDIISQICCDGKDFGLVTLSSKNNQIVQFDVFDIVSIKVDLKGDVIKKTERLKF